MDDLISPPTRGDRLLALVHRTSCAARQLRRRLAALADNAGLSDNEVLVLWLAEGVAGGLVQGDLATAIGISPAQMSGIVERLRKRGLIAMERSPLDRRRQVWRSTLAGGEVLESLKPGLFAIAEHLDALVSPDEQQAAVALCQQLAEALSPENQSPEIQSPESDSTRRIQEAA